MLSTICHKAEADSGLSGSFGKYALLSKNGYAKPKSTPTSIRLCSVSLIIQSTSLLRHQYLPWGDKMSFGSDSPGSQTATCNHFKEGPFAPDQSIPINLSNMLDYYAY